MNKTEIIRLKKQSFLKELVNSALSNLEDESINGFNVVDLVCARGMSDAKVYLDPSFIEEEEKEILLSKLKNANGFIRSYCLKEFAKVPKFTYYFDDTLDNISKIDKLLDKALSEI